MWSKEQEEAIQKLKHSEGFEKEVYYPISSKEDIKKLMQATSGFHDSVIVAASYSNTRWCSNGAITDSEDDEIFTVVFRSQWVDSKIELVFEGLRRSNLIGFQSRYPSYILDCYLDFFNGLIVFADSSSFNPADLKVKTWIEESCSRFRKKTTITDVETETLLREPMTTFIVSKSLKWRLTKENNQ